MIVDRLRSLVGETRTTGVGTLPHEGTDPASSEPASTLYSCAECDVVYIAVDMEICSNCRGEVTEESATLSDG